MSNNNKTIKGETLQPKMPRRGALASRLSCNFRLQSTPPSLGIEPDTEPTPRNADSDAIAIAATAPNRGPTR